MVVLALGLCVGASACSDDEPAVCADAETLRADLDDLGSIEIQPGSLADFSAALDEAADDVDQLVEDASSEFETEIDAVQSATKALTDSVETATQDPSAASVTQVSADFGVFTTAVEDLRTAVADSC